MGRIYPTTLCHEGVVFATKTLSCQGDDILLSLYDHDDYVYYIILIQRATLASCSLINHYSSMLHDLGVSARLHALQQLCPNVLCLRAVQGETPAPPLGSF